MSAFALLGLTAEADELAIKRAYARLLKTTRPDDDPAGFQRLHEAYTYCLACARERALYGDDGDEEDVAVEVEPLAEVALVAADRTVPAATFLPSQASVEPPEAEVARFDWHALRARREEVGIEIEIENEQASDADDEVLTKAEDEASDDPSTVFHADTFLEELVGRLHRDTPTALTAWLQGNEALYSLQLKQMLRSRIAHTLAHSDPFPARGNVEAVLQFFGLDGVGQDQAWLMQPLHHLWQRLDDARRLEDILHSYRSAKPVDRMLLRELTTPRHWLRFLFILLFPVLPSRTRSLLLSLEEAGQDATRALLNPSAANFWRRAADPDAMSWPRTLTILTRWLVMLGAMATLFAPSALQSIAVTSLLVCTGSVVGTMAWRRLVR